MKIQEFIGVLTFVEKTLGLPANAVFVFRERKVPGRLEAYDSPAGIRLGDLIIRATLRRPLSLKWKDAFEVLDAKSLKSVGQGTILYFCLIRGSRLSRRIEAELLRGLSGGEKAMLEAVCRDKGFAGLRQREILEFTEFEPSRLLRVAQKLEQEGKVKILRFSPLFLISEESFNFLLEQIMRYVEKYHEKHPGRKGAPLDRLQKRFALSGIVFRLALKALEQAGRARREGQRLVLPSHEIRLSVEEERILGRLEEMCYKGELRFLSWEDIRKEFQLSPERLESLLAILIERKKIFQGAEGLYIHGHWLEEVIGRVRSLGKKEMTVGEFKAVTGLSRKYAIPLLELLDQMRVTRRKGPTREVL